MTLFFFSGFSFILHLAQNFASFRRSFWKRFAGNCKFLLAAHRAVSSANWDWSFDCGEVLVSH